MGDISLWMGGGFPRSTPQQDQAISKRLALVMLFKSGWDELVTHKAICSCISSASLGGSSPASEINPHRISVYSLFHLYIDTIKQINHVMLQYR